jgi:hypothetical protein
LARHLLIRKWNFGDEIDPKCGKKAFTLPNLAAQTENTEKISQDKPLSINIFFEK